MIRIYSIFIIFIAFIYSQLTFAESNIPNFYFDQISIGDNSCLMSNNGCSISIEKPLKDVNGKIINYIPVEFKSQPLIFVMPTIDYGSDDFIGRDAPATLRITSISRGSDGGYKFTVKQDVANYNNEFLNLYGYNYPVYWYYWSEYQEIIRKNINSENKIKNKKSRKFKNLESKHIVSENKLWENVPFSLYVKPMPLITYFAIEPGTIDLAGKGKIIAGTVSLTKFIDSKTSLYKGSVLNENKLNNLIDSQLVKTISNDGFSSNMGVIINDQPNNSNRWVTPYSIIYNGNTYIGLDGSEVNTNSTINAINVAYLQVEGKGVFKGLNFILGRGDTKNTLQNNLVFPDSVTKPIEEECNAYMDINNTSFDFSDLVNKPLMFLASKNSRKGPNGGWLRLCNRKNSGQSLQVSFVNDEDLNERNVRSIERKHHDESVGFMAFQRQVSETTCSLFPGPIQTWQGNTSGTLKIEPKIIIKGVPFTNGEKRIGFDHIYYGGNPTYKACDGYICEPEGQLANKINLGYFPPNDDGDLNNQGNVNKLHNKKIYFFNMINLNNKRIIFPNGSIVHAKNLSMVSSSLRSESNNPDDLIIYIHDKPSSGHLWSEINNGSSITALIYSEREIDISNGNVNGCSDYETCPEVSRINGAVTAKAINAHGNYKMIGVEINGKSSCFASTPNYTLALSPDITSTLCDSKKITFSVNSTNSDTYNRTVSFTLTSTSSGEWSTTENFTANTTHKFTSGSHTYQINIKNNHASIWLRSDGVATVNINASIENNTVTAIGQYQFSMADDVYFSMTNKQENIIAGKTFNTTITAKICGIGNKAKTLTQYSGPKFLYLKTDYIQPTTPAFDALDDGKTTTPIKVEVITGSAIRATDYLDIKFDKGVSPKLTLKYREAGVIKWQVTDPNYTFEKIQLSGKKRRLTKSISINGVLDIKSRPWTFAICPLTFNGKNEYDNASGTSNGGEAYTAAGKPFDIVAKPLIWQNGDSNSESAMIDVSEQTYCNRPVTKNFFATGAPSLNDGVILSEYGLDSPKKGQLGQFFSQPQMNNNQYKLSGLLIANNSWSEVGSLWVKANLNNYLGMVVNPSRRHIGRFYPAYFKLEDNNVTPAIGDFTYMNQPFNTGFKLGAYNYDGNLVYNYLGFNQNLKAKFKINTGNYKDGSYTALDNRFNRCKDLECIKRDGVAQALTWPSLAQKKYSQIIFPSVPFVVSRVKIPNSDITTIPDGPFFDWQLRIKQTDKPDGVTWQSGVTSNNQGVLVGNNDLRYGRMALQDAAGDIGKSLTIPLRVEYWNGAEFVTNSDDSASTFDGANYCRQILIQEPAPHTPNNPTTSGAGTVNLGQPLFNQLIANPDGDFKQQIRFWQRLSAFTKPTKIAKTPKIYCKDSASNQPWLSYNWRGIGDEDPSATVTFGVYHGNNRIIYRGETNDAGQSIPYLNYQ
ncbi:DUF6701 domain-containing protein [Photobacterium carnosum]|uniref:DUF6701 domain-containing protein n=1 Tax=Photobacterium carnosum TaxID=2023717 RepID=UPI00128CE40B|nr:DUF6701 domain-containing protein [Photobacterium carnosum]KAE8176667.1 hypothetical protein CIT27_11425 [Photobacterium carnosum]